ncbi:MAG: serine/threonine-protein kinase PknK, partial [Steroidobacteraceae bacterium]
MELIRHHGQTVLLIEDHGAEVLARLLGKPWDLDLFLRVATGSTVALGCFHRRGLVHKDINPASIFVRTSTGEAWLSRFGLVSRLARDRETPAPSRFISGTLAYMAPEQTGRMNRSSDSRSDLYSLGVTFYEMLTGELPFTASEPMEWIHAHVAKQPTPPGERAHGIPEAISGIVLKLLAKNAEDRYQTAAGLEADLRKCLDQSESQGRIDPFPLGTHDVPDRLVIPERLYGREGEIRLLLTALDRVVNGGPPELVLVSGYSGIGKSSVVNEVQKALPPRGLFASGKFDQYKRDIPYATLAQALEHLVRYILSLSETELGHWREDLRQALGPNGQLILNLIPQLELIVGPQPPVPDLPPRDAQNRFQMVLRRLLGVFASATHPLVLFLDDLQWLDAATLDLFELLITAPELRHLLLTGAYRDNEVDSSHPLMRRLEAIRRSGARVHDIVLAPLGFDDLSELISEMLHCEREHVQPLTQLVQEKTGGNPFFAIQFLAELNEAGLIAFDRDAPGWTWNPDRIRAKNYTDNVADLLVGKVDRLSSGTKDALRQLACLGDSAPIGKLALIYGQSEDEIDVTLSEAVRTGLILRVDGAYTFLHDRVHEAAYSLIPEAERAATHLRIGRLLLAHTAPEKREESIFEIVNQLNRSIALIVSPEEREQVAELNLIAGKRAKASTAYTSALNYFSVGGTQLTADVWERRYELVFATEINRAECEFLAGDFAAARGRLEVLSLRAANVVDKAATTCLWVTLYTVLDRPDRAVEIGLEYLREVSMPCTPHPTDEELREEYEQVWRRLGERPIEALFDLPLMSDPAYCATMDVLMAVWPPAYFFDVRLFDLFMLRIANLSIEHGNSDGSSFAYASLETTVGWRFGNYRAGSRFGRLGLDLVDKKGLDRFKARVYISVGNMAFFWPQQVPGVALIRRGFEAALETGDLSFASVSYNTILLNRLANGDPLEEI